MSMSTLRELRSKLNLLQMDIETILNGCGFLEYGEISTIDYDVYDPDQRQEMNEFYYIMESLDRINRTLTYLQRSKGPALTLRKNSRGRYETESREYTAGSGIEYLRGFEDYGPDGDLKLIQEWRTGTVEYSHERGDYYIVNYPEIRMEGLTVRERS